MYKFLFAEIESAKSVVTKSHLRVGHMIGDQYTFDIDFGWVANVLWTFIGEHVTDTVYNNRGVLAGGHNNGLDNTPSITHIYFWRSLRERKL